jgi:hypothetical protein
MQTNVLAPVCVYLLRCNDFEVLGEKRCKFLLTLKQWQQALNKSEGRYEDTIWRVLFQAVKFSDDDDDN